MPLLDALSPLDAGLDLLLILLSVLTSAFTAAFGVGGGVLMIMALAQVMPATALIPVHGMVQLGSNVGRVAMTWRHVDRATLLLGAVTTLLSSLVGASGPMVAAFIKQRQDGRLAKVATFSACMVAQHLTKAFVFGVAGFVFHDWLGLILAMVAAGFLGTWLGLRLLRRLSDRHFDGLFRAVLTLLALRLVWLGLQRLAG